MKTIPYLIFMLVILVMLTFASNSPAQNTVPENVVRLIYFLPKGRTPQPDINTELDTYIKNAQQFYLEVMVAHGFGEKTFQFEANTSGNAIVHRFNGKFPVQYYHDQTHDKVWEEIKQHYDTSKHIYVTVVDTGRGSLGGGAIGYGGANGAAGGEVLMPYVPNIPIAFSGILAHELAHAFGLHHDYRISAKLKHSSVFPGGDAMNQSFCAAEWLDVHRYFNTDPTPTAFNEPPTIERLSPPSLAAPPNAIRFRFKVTDPDGLHQAQLRHTSGGDTSLIDYKQLNGTSSTVEFVTTELSPRSTSVSVQVIDVNGNFSGREAKSYPVDVISLLPPPEVVQIPDANLDAAVRTALNLTSEDVITTHAMLNLRSIVVKRSEIKDFTGLEHAYNLEQMNLLDGAISDVSLLTQFTQLLYLNLNGGTISDVSALTQLTQLRTLHLPSNAVSDVSPLVQLTQLMYLNLADNPLSDASLNTHIPAIQANGTWVDIGHEEGIPVDAAELPPKIEGPWLWMILPTQQNLSGADAALRKDWLAAASGGTVTETQIATNGATTGNTIKDRVWTYGKLPPTGDDNITQMVNAIGLGNGGNIEYHVAYGSIALDSPREQRTEMSVGSDDAVKVWLNGVAVYTNPVNRGASDYQEGFGVTLKKGKNVLLVAIYQGGGAWSGFFGLDAEYTILDVMEDVPTFPAWDVNQDGQVNILDLVLVAQHLGGAVLTNSRADVNDDGTINILDLVVVAQHLGESAAAAPFSVAIDDSGLEPAAIQAWIAQAEAKSDGSLVFQQGIANLQRLLASLLPEKTALLANYPNPFNPETWIPYQLAKDADITLHIYTMNGTLVRTLALGHKAAGMYQSRSRAAYWDGKNEVGEKVASGVYFYTLTAGDFTATRKMLIAK